MSELKQYFNFLLESKLNDKEVLKESALLEGGLAGHMSHVREFFTSTDEFLQFWKDFFDGKYDTFEKVDGSNIYFSFDKGKAIFARNPNEEPFSDPAKKFPALHPAHEAFVIGCNAINEGLNKVSKELLIKCQLINEDGSSKGFINTEVMYGEFPNLIQYSDVVNYIVFHNIHNGKDKKYTSMNLENSKALLTELANAINEVSISIPISTFKITGSDISSVKKIAKKIDSIWEFKGPINISKDKIKDQLNKIKEEFESIPEVKALRNTKDLSEDEKFKLMKKLSEKIGNDILLNLESTLYKSKIRKTGADHPKIEGLAIPIGDSIVKITGEFRNIADVLWAPLAKDIPEVIEEFATFLKTELEIKSKNKNITPKDVSLIDDEAVLTSKNKKNIKQYIEQKLISKLQSHIDKLVSGNNIKKDNILNNYKIFSYKLKKMMKDMNTINTKKQLMTSYIQKD